MRSFYPYPLAFVLGITFSSFLAGAIVEAELPTSGKTLVLSAVFYRFWMVLEWTQIAQDTFYHKKLLVRILAFGVSSSGLQSVLQLDKLLVSILWKS